MKISSVFLIIELGFEIDFNTATPTSYRVYFIHYTYGEQELVVDLNELVKHKTDLLMPQLKCKLFDLRKELVSSSILLSITHALEAQPIYLYHTIILRRCCLPSAGIRCNKNNVFAVWKVVFCEH